MASRHYLACDLGAESGRLMLGRLEGNRLALDPLHRFPNLPRKVEGSLTWDIPGLFEELKKGLRVAARTSLTFSGISTDSWGVDYLLLNAAGGIMEPTFHYRDSRTAEGVRKVKAAVDWPTIFSESGIQDMPLNTLYQLAAESRERLTGAHRLLLIGDGFNYLLSGVACAEVSMASTTQLYNPVTKAWSDRLLQALDLPRSIFPSIVTSGTRLGPMLHSLARATGLPEIEVLASCSHDTGAAVAAVPASGGHWAYISSGTWSLMGIECAQPILTDACRDLNFTNEIGYGNSVRLLKNIIGLWLVQECRRHWEREGRSFDYAALTDLAGAAEPFRSLIDPADPRFIAPDNMPGKIASFCRESGQPEPRSEGEFIRCALESLALLYRKTARELESLTGHSLERLHIVGGGSQNGLLNQFAASALGVPVVAGPVEATAAGNVLVQALATGALSDLEAAREVVRQSFAVTTILPTDHSQWERAAERFASLAGS